MFITCCFALSQTVANASKILIILKPTFSGSLKPIIPTEMMNYTFTLAPNELEAQLKQLIIQESDKTDDINWEDISDDEPLFGDKSRVALDSLDALQISVALQQHFKVRLQGDRAVRQHMITVRDLAAFVRSEHGA